MFRQSVKTAGVLSLTAAVLFGCSGGSKPAEVQGESQAEKPKEPVTLTFYDPNAGQLQETFMEQYGNLIVKKYPHITIKYVSSPDTNPEAHITSMIAAGDPIDVMLNADLNHYRLIAPFKFEYDMTELIKKNKYDLSQLDPSILQAVQTLSGGGMYALPFRMNTLGLMYNKDIFDQFGKPYPKDGMTWDETYELARQMTRSVDGIEYRGFITQFYNMGWLNQQSLGFIDPKTDKPIIHTDEKWAAFTRNLSRFYEIPGNVTKEGSFSGIANLFLKSKTAAMYAYTIPTTPQEVNWDVVQLPEFSDKRGVGAQSMLTLAYITSISKHKEAAFDAISYMTSDEMQTHIAKQALGLPVINNKQVKDVYGQDNPNLKGKNVKSLLISKPAAPFVAAQHNRTVALQFEKMMYTLTKGGVDVNTALRTAAEEAEKEIAKIKSGSK